MTTATRWQDLAHKLTPEQITQLDTWQPEYGFTPARHESGLLAVARGMVTTNRYAAQPRDARGRYAG